MGLGEHNITPSVNYWHNGGSKQEPSSNAYGQALHSIWCY